MYRLQFLVLFLVVVAGLFFMYQTKVGLPLRELFFGSNPVMYINDVPIHVEIADSTEELALGLSNRPSLVGIDGLLMVFPTAGYPRIWMKDMLFPISIIWISEDLHVVDITHQLRPESYPKIYEPAQRTKYVLETDTLFLDTFKVQIGDSVRLPKVLAK